MKPILEEERVKESDDPIPELAKEFKVSEELMRKRLEFEKIIRY